MITRRIHNATHVFKAPANWDEEANGKCSDLAVRIGDGVCASAWEPTPAELEILNRGGSVVLHIWGGQPPVALTVEENNPPCKCSQEDVHNYGPCHEDCRSLNR